MQAVDSSATTVLPPVSLVRDNPCERVDNALKPSSQTPELGQTPSLVDIEDSSLQPPENGSYAQIPDMLHGSSSAPEPVTPSLDGIKNTPVNIDADGIPVEVGLVAEESDQEENSSMGMEMAEQAANDEWQRQNMEYRMKEDIHHFNFLGDGVPYKNATPPAVSLLVVVTGAKAVFADNDGSSDPFRYAVMRSAMSHVDPVIYRGPEENLCLRGERLRDAVTGACEKFYSEHGTWRFDEYQEDEDRPSLDSMDVCAYPFHSIPVNGWFENAHVGDRWGLQAHSLELDTWSQQLRQDISKRQHACERKGSLLHLMTSVEDLDTVPEENTQMAKAETHLKVDDGTKKADSGWTVDLDKYLGKCNNWADEVDDEDECPLEVGSVGVDGCPSAGVQDGEVESGTETDAGFIPAPASNVDILPEPLPESTLVDEDEKITELPSPLTAPQTDAVPSDSNVSVPGWCGEGMSEEELEVEDREIYGDSSVASNDLLLLLQRLHESGLIARNAGASASWECSEEAEEEEDAPSSAPMSRSKSLPMGGSFTLPIPEKPFSQVDDPQTVPAAALDSTSLPTTSSRFTLPIRGKPVSLLDAPQTVSTAALDSTSLPTSSSSFCLPIRVKQPGASNLPEATLHRASIDSHGDNHKTESASGERMSNGPLVRPSTPPSSKALFDLHDGDQTDANEEMSPILPDTLNCIVMPLRPRKHHGRRSTDSSSDLLRASTEAEAEPDALVDTQQTPSRRAGEGEDTSLTLPTEASEVAIVSPKQMLEEFENALLTPSKKRRGIPRSGTFLDLTDLVPKGASLRNTGRESSLRYRAQLQKGAEPWDPKPKARSKQDKLDAISEEDEVEVGTETLTQKVQLMQKTSADIIAHANHVEALGDVVTEKRSREQVAEHDHVAIPDLPVRSLYRQLATNTPRRPMCRATRSDISADTYSDGSSKISELLDEVDGTTVVVEGTGEHALYALKNWSGVFGHDDNVDPGFPTSVNPEDIPMRGETVTAGSSTATESEGVPTSDSSYVSSHDTRATTPIEAPKAMKDVEIVRPKSSWAKVKQKLTGQQPSPRPKLPGKKAKFTKSVKKFLAKSLEAFSLIGQTGI